MERQSVKQQIDEIVRTSSKEYIESVQNQHQMKFEKRRKGKTNGSKVSKNIFEPIPYRDEFGNIDWYMEDRKV
jgi:hypothetical protein